EHLHGVVVAGADQEIFIVRRELDAARSLAHGDRLLHLQRRAVQHGDRVPLLVEHVEVMGPGGPCPGDKANRRGDCNHERICAHAHPPYLSLVCHWNLHSLSGSSMPSVSTSACSCRKPSCGEVETGKSGPATMIGCLSWPSQWRDVTFCPVHAASTDSSLARQAV